MNHLEILKRGLRITWRYRPLWIFGFLLALCGGGGGGGGGGSGGNFNFPSGDQDFEDLPNLPDISPDTIFIIIIALVILVLLLGLVSIVVRQVTRAALIGMVFDIEKTAVVTARDGWRFGWSARAWRIFLINVIIGVPLAVLSLFLILMSFSPLLLLLAEATALKVTGVVLTVAAFLLVILFLLVLNAVITPVMELSWRSTALAQRGVFDSFRSAFSLIRQHLKDVVILWLLLFGVGIAWAILTLVVVLPVSLLAAALAGGIPALVVWLVSNSWLGAAIAGVPLALLALILVMSFATGLYLTFNSSVWTLGYLNMQPPALDEPAPEAGGPGPVPPEPAQPGPAAAL